MEGDRGAKSIVLGIVALVVIGGGVYLLFLSQQHTHDDSHPHPENILE